MAVTGKPVTVSTTAVDLSAAAATPDFTPGGSIAIIDCTVDLFLAGTSAVTAAGGTAGAKLAAGKSLALDLGPDDHLWAIAGSSGVAQVIRTGV